MVVVVVEKALRAAATAAIVAECLLLGAFLELLLLLLLQLEKTPLSTDDQTRASANRALLQISIPITARRTNMHCVQCVCAKAPWPEARSRRPLTRPSPAAWSLHSSTINLLQLQLWPIFARFRTLSLSLSPLSIYLAALSAPRRATLAAWPGLAC